MEVWAIVLAAGGGDRFGDRKQFCELDGRSLLNRVLITAATVGCRTVAVVPADVADRPRRDATRTVAGGATRSQSVRAGLAAVPDDVEIVVVAEAARPLASLDLWRKVISEVDTGAAAVTPVLPVSDSVRWCDGPPLDRALIRSVQTPQAFNAAALREVHADGDECTDDAGLFEDAVMVEGEPWNIKVTWPGDLAVAAALRHRRAS